ncbi:uncharacterized protein [Dasypus novemcinctus]|uniref:uncharacterized protein isoform X1 n=1 Tax=Dasypus novemcinctus TaxID=9361 RepID=UPI00265FEAC8|nr:uncharacterized protein LOC101432256 isoform X1 [Dasypus novemcinctus]
MSQAELRAALEERLRALAIRTEVVEHPEVFTVEEMMPHIQHLKGAHKRVVKTATTPRNRDCLQLQAQASHPPAVWDQSPQMRGRVSIATSGSSGWRNKIRIRVDFLVFYYKIIMTLAMEEIISLMWRQWSWELVKAGRGKRCDMGAFLGLRVVLNDIAGTDAGHYISCHNPLNGLGESVNYNVNYNLCCVAVLQNVFINCNECIALMKEVVDVGKVGGVGDGAHRNLLYFLM